MNISKTYHHYDTIIYLSTEQTSTDRYLSFCARPLTQNVYKMRSFLCRRCFLRVMCFSELGIVTELLICYIIRSGAARVSLWTGPEVDEDCGRAGDGGFRYIHTLL